LILTTDSDLLRMFKKLEPAKARTSKPNSVAGAESHTPAAGTHE
jgi:hypothetical protein